jgi:hypothetical protein
VTTAIVAQPGSTNVTVNMLSGTQPNVGGGVAPTPAPAPCDTLGS